MLPQALIDMWELLVGVGQLIGIVVAAILIKRTLDRKVEEVKQEALEFYAAEKKDIIDNLPGVMESFGNAMFAKVRGMFAGQASGLARLDKGLAEAITQDAVGGENPLLGMILERFPTAKKYIAKNPAAIGQLMGIANQFMQQGQQQGLNRRTGPYKGSMRY